MMEFYDLLSRNITTSEKIMFKGLGFYGLKRVQPTYVCGFNANFPYGINENLLGQTNVSSAEIQIIDGAIGTHNNFLIKMFRTPAEIYNQIKIVPFTTIEQNYNLMSKIVSDYAIVTGRSIGITPYTKDIIIKSECLREAIVRVNHIIQILLAFGKIGITLSMIMQTVLNTIFPGSHYIAQYKMTENRKTIEVGSGGTVFYTVDVSTNDATSFTSKDAAPKMFEHLIKVHSLQILELTNVGLFIYLTCEIINSILSKTTIYMDS